MNTPSGLASGEVHLNPELPLDNAVINHIQQLADLLYTKERSLAGLRIANVNVASAIIDLVQAGELAKAQRVMDEFWFEVENPQTAGIKIKAWSNKVESDDSTQKKIPHVGTIEIDPEEDSPDGILILTQSLDDLAKNLESKHSTDYIRHNVGTDVRQQSTATPADTVNMAILTYKDLVNDWIRQRKTGQLINFRHKTIYLMECYLHYLLNDRFSEVESVTRAITQLHDFYVSERLDLPNDPLKTEHADDQTTLHYINALTIVLSEVLRASELKADLIKLTKTIQESSYGKKLIDLLLTKHNAQQHVSYPEIKEAIPEVPLSVIDDLQRHRFLISYLAAQCKFYTLSETGIFFAQEIFPSKP